MTELDELRMILREDDIPMFKDEELEYFLKKDGFSGAAYRLLLRKAENTTLKVSGLDIGDNSQYFRMIAKQYRPNHSGILKG